jgi:hypothetical protein
VAFTQLPQRAFAGGELDPALAMRADLAKYTTGLRTCRNFLVQRQGGVRNRSGTYLAAETKLSGASACFLERYVFAAADESYLIECGDYYFRFYWHGALVTVSGVAAYDNAHTYAQSDLVVSGGVTYYATQTTTGHAPPNTTYWHPLVGNIYEVPTPYGAGAFQAPAPACFAQSGDVITITQLDVPPMELRRYARTHWTLTPIVTTPAIAAPANVAFTPGTPAPVPPPDGTTVGYVVTAVDANAVESIASAITLGSSLQERVTVGSVANPNVITWDAVGGAASYNIYKDSSGAGIYGFMWTTAAGVTTYNDSGLEGNSSRTPPVARALFDATLKYPAVSCTYQQRRILAGTHTDRELVEASVIGKPSSFGMHTPLQDDDSVEFKLAGEGVHPVIHLIPLVRLVLLTDMGEWTLEGDDTGALTPTAINPQQHGYVGCSFTRPVIIGTAVIFVQARGRIVRDLRPITGSQDQTLLSGRDLSVLAAHLFKSGAITGMAFAANPDSIVWAVRADGALLGLTYLPEEDVWGWHRHDTGDGDVFESVAVVPEGEEDVVYVVVKRTINGSPRRFVERFASRDYTDVVEACFVDSAVRQSASTATTAVTGLTHLEGRTVAVFADGVVQASKKVTGGAITLTTAAKVVQVGLPITADLETLDLDVSGTALRAKQKRVVSLQLQLLASSLGFSVGPDYNNLRPVLGGAWQTGLVSDLVDVNPTSSFTASGRMVIRHTAPAPLTVLGVIPTVEVGG